MKPNYLAVGIAASVTLHAIVLPFVHREQTVAQGEPPLVLRRERIPTPPPTPPPTPTPAPTHPPTPPPLEQLHTPAPQTHDLRIKTHKQDPHPHTGAGEPGNTHTHGDEHGTPTDRGTPGPAGTDAPATASPPSPTPTPHPTPTPLSCARPDVPATTLHAMDVETPQLAQQQGIAGTVQVVVSLNAQSRVTATRIQSSPSTLLNAAALATARGSQFRTEIKNCEPIAADYIFSVDFTAQ